MTTPFSLNDLLNDYDPEKDPAGAPNAEEAQKRWSAGFAPPADEFRRFVDAKERGSGLAAEMAKGSDELLRLPGGIKRLIDGRKWSDVLRILVDEVNNGHASLRARERQTAVAGRRAVEEYCIQHRLMLVTPEAWETACHGGPKSSLTGPEKLTPSPIRELAGPDSSGDDVCADADPVGIVRRPR